MTAARFSSGTDPLAERLIEPVPGGFFLGVRSVLWLALQLTAAIAGKLAVGGLFIVVGGLSAAQTARTWRAAGLRAHQGVAGWGAAVVVAASLWDLAWAGGALIGVVAAAVGLAVVRSGPGGVVVSAGSTVRSAVGPAAVGVAMVQLASVSWSLVVMLVVLAAGYDLACNVWSSDGAGPLVGRVMGVATVVVLTLGATAVHTVLRVDPFATTAGVVVFGAMAAVLLPLGPMVASVILPAPDASAPALRRLDALLVAAPVWMVAMWGYLA